jgi:hypothetical protein
MELEVLLPCSQDPVTSPYPEPVQSIPHHRIQSLESHFNIIHLSTFLSQNVEVKRGKAVSVLH